MKSTVPDKMMALIPGVLANSVVFAIVAYIAFLHAWYPDLYYLNVQEDEFLEWATFWAFFLHLKNIVSLNITEKLFKITFRTFQSGNGLSIDILFTFYGDN